MSDKFSSYADTIYGLAEELSARADMMLDLAAHAGNTDRDNQQAHLDHIKSLERQLWAARAAHAVDLMEALLVIRYGKEAAAYGTCQLFDMALAQRNDEMKSTPAHARFDSGLQNRAYEAALYESAGCIPDWLDDDQVAKWRPDMQQPGVQND